MDRIRVAVLGASGYTGAELVRLALGHPRMDLAVLSANAKAGQGMASIWPHFFPHSRLPSLVRAEEIDWGRIDVVFGCLPHATSAEILSGVRGPRIIDLSADFRLRDAAVYAEWYGKAHPAPDLIDEAVYGLTEFARDALSAARLVSCPGCYPTAALLALLPLVEAGVVGTERMTINALSGVSGSGRGLKESSLFAELAEATHAYGVGGHRHMPEIEQELSRRVHQPVRVGFTPHLVPMSRGELETITVELANGATPTDLRDVLQRRYADEPFVHLLPVGVAPSTRMVRGSNHCVLNVFADRVPGRATVIVAIDNLVKGSSGQALQNMNRMFGWRETLGLEAAPLFP